LQVIKQIHLQVRTDLRLLEQVLAWFGQLRHPPIPEEVWLAVSIALAEMFTNTVRHAHRDLPPETPIDLEALILSQALGLKVWDCGPQVDLLQWIAALPENIPATDEGGRGLGLIRKIADEMSYGRTDEGRNCFYIAKYF
jgi:serine/threonine-protein kinase RsbW